MNIEEAKEQLLKHKKEIDAEYISARYSKAIEVVLSELDKKDKILDKKEGHNWQLERGIGSKAYVVKRIDLLREQLLELKKSL